MNKLSGEEEARRQELYRRGLTDGALADAIGCSKSCVTGWRRRRGLAANLEEKAGAGRRRCMGKTNAKASKTQAEIAAASRRENMERIAREAGLARAAGMSYGAWKARTGNKEDI